MPAPDVIEKLQPSLVPSKSVSAVNGPRTCLSVVPTPKSMNSALEVFDDTSKVIVPVACVQDASTSISKDNPEIGIGRRVAGDPT